ncbi:MAG TPA: aminotransferase class V-fold PLP-dependent enzyme, partial [Longimicrobiales bacterium]|nr:aminotransferase class V-fold PLP-dependent enzyme [Longimicrobiales bacterium]
TLDVARRAGLARSAGVLTLVDVAQAAGHLPFSAAATGVDMVAFTGHKGLLGPQGIGGLWVREGVDVEPLLTGGSGGDSLLREMPRPLPDRLQAGSLNGPGIAGLLAGVDAVLAEGVDVIHARIAALKRRLHRELSALDHVRVLSPPGEDGVGIVTVVSDVADPAQLALRLDREFGVLVRAGLHCAPEAHRLLGSEGTGAVRFSLGWSSTDEDVERAVAAMARIVGARVSA